MPFLTIRMPSQASLAIEEKTATDAISITAVTAITFSPILSLGTAANTTRWARPPALESAGGSCPRPTSGRRRWMLLLHSWRNPCSPLLSCPCLQSCASTAKKPTVVSAEFLLLGTSGAELYIRAVNAAALMETPQHRCRCQSRRHPWRRFFLATCYRGRCSRHHCSRRILWLPNSGDGVTGPLLTYSVPRLSQPEQYQSFRK